MSEDRVRVLQLVQHAALGGGTLMAMVLAERLNPERYEVAMAVGPEAGGEGSLLEEMRARGIEVITIPHLCRRPDPLRDARAVWELAHVLTDRRPDIVHTHGSKPKLLLPPAARIAPVPVKVAHIWGWEWQPAKHAVERELFTMESRLVAHAYDALIACSAAMRREGLARGVGGPERYEVVLPSVDLTRFTPDGREEDRHAVRAELGIDDGAFVVASVTRLARQKAPLVLVAAAAAVSAAAPHVQWIIVGGGPLENAVRALVRELGLEDRVHLLGPRRDVPRLLRACDAFALSSSWEPFGIVYLEAAAVGLPVVGTAVDGAPEAVIDGETGILVEPGRPAKLAAAIMRLVADPELARRMGEAGMRRARQFGHERFVAGVEAVYERLLARATAQR